SAIGPRILRNRVTQESRAGLVKYIKILAVHCCYRSRRTKRRAPRSIDWGSTRQRHGRMRHAWKPFRSYRRLTWIFNNDAANFTYAHLGWPFRVFGRPRTKLRQKARQRDSRVAESKSIR